MGILKKRWTLLSDNGFTHIETFDNFLGLWECTKTDNLYLITKNVGLFEQAVVVNATNLEDAKDNYKKNLGTILVIESSKEFEQVLQSIIKDNQ